MNKYIDDLFDEDLENLQGLIRDLRDFSLYQSTDEWASLTGKYYIRLYGRPSEWDSCDRIGATLIYYFGSKKGSLEHYPKLDTAQNLSPQEKSHACAYWRRRLKWWQERLIFSRDEDLESEIELDAIAKCNKILELFKD